MSQAIQAIRGMNDLLPADSHLWQWLEQQLRQLVHTYAYQEMRTPIVEKTQLFKRAVGEVTDIIEKEMYSFHDRNGDSLSLRPEQTAACVRAALEHSLLYRQTQRLWYMGPMFRHERPQRGRYRQFYQFGVEAFGMADAESDAEVIAISARLWKILGLQSHVVLQLNCIGDSTARQSYRHALVDYLTPLYDQLDQDSQRRLKQNPLRILDSKNQRVQQLLMAAPKLSDFISTNSAEHFQHLCQQLSNLGIDYQLQPNLVRGLDYYNDTVFEWVTDKLGAQATVCAGGRYDGLVEQLGGHATPAVGFSLGVERLIELLKIIEQAAGQAIQLADQADIYIIINGESAQQQAFQWAEHWRSVAPQWRVMMNIGGGSFKAQFKRADKSGAKIALILGQQELQHNSVTVKYLRHQQSQQSLAIDQVGDWLESLKLAD